MGSEGRDDSVVDGSDALTLREQVDSDRYARLVTSAHRRVLSLCADMAVCTRAALVLGLLAMAIPTAANHEVADVTACIAATGRACGPVLASGRVTAFRERAATAQDPSVVEMALGLDRPTRRLIQQGLRNEGFDPGAPDGLFGPRTRGAVRRWQEAQGRPPTGYLDSAQTEVLRAASAPRSAESERTATVARADAAQAVNCDDWHVALDAAIPEPGRRRTQHPTGVGYSHVNRTGWA